MLNRDQIKFYEENGYLVIEDAIAPEQLDALGRVTGEFIERSRLLGGSNDVYDLDAGHSAAEPRLPQIIRFCMSSHIAVCGTPVNGPELPLIGQASAAPHS